jgi:signal peptidase II
MIFIIVIAVIALDQLSKFIIGAHLAAYQSLPVIKGIFHLTLVHNRGAAFGMLKNQLFLFILTSLGAVILIIFDLRQRRGEKFGLYSLALSLILAGALGNLIDRVSFGYVIDFLDFRVWPVFNLADSAITVGAVILGWKLLRAKPCIR